MPRTDAHRPSAINPDERFMVHVIMSNDYPVAVCATWGAAEHLLRKLRAEDHANWIRSPSLKERYMGSGECYIRAVEFEVVA